VTFLHRDGVKIFFEVRGDGPALLLTHGFSASSAMYAQNVEALARTHRVITWDLRGHGQSDSPADPAAYSTALAVGDMVALLDAAGAERALIAGHSLGGFLSLELQLAQRARVAALLLIGTGPGYRSDGPRAAWNDMVEKMAARFERKGLAALGDGEEVRLAAHRDASGGGLARARASSRSTTAA
jgi:pimeloyl-ACP methyl ester carboxylesterase